ncbi:MAG TPA: hypothetical protein VJT72_18665 [Pseudonocardiaceae bacterium]|nr:hypothetical protein [Pseudonocardiaceae bacterium]
MTNDTATTYAQDPDVIAGLLESIEATQQRIDNDNRLLAAHVSRLRAGGCSWEAIGQRLGISKQAAQQRFVRYCAVEYLDDWVRHESQGKLVYWGRRRSDKTWLTVAKADDGGWEWAYRSPHIDTPSHAIAKGTAGSVPAAKRAAEAAAEAN